MKTYLLNNDNSEKQYSNDMYQYIAAFMQVHAITIHTDEGLVIDDIMMEHSDFDQYIRDMFALVNLSKTNRQFPSRLREILTRTNLKGLSANDPKFIEAFMELENMTFFNPACATKVELSPSPVQAKLPTFSYPEIDPDLQEILFELDFVYPQFNCSFVQGLLAWQGHTVRNVTGFSYKAYLNQLNKLHKNIVAPSSEWTPRLLLSTLKLMNRWGVTSPPTRFEYNRDKLLKLLNKNTSIGYMVDQFMVYTSLGYVPVTSLKKKDVALHALDIFEEWIDDIDRFISGELTEFPRLVFMDLEMVKHEVVWNHEVIMKTMNEDQLSQLEHKVRLFYMSSVEDYILSSVTYSIVGESLRYYESAIGVKAEAGGLQIIYDKLSPDNLTEEQHEVIDEYSEVADLSEFQYGQGDWESFDQTLLAVVLIFVAFFSKPFFDPGEYSKKKFDLIFMHFVQSVVQKVMHVFAYGYYEVFGCMFSGKYITSVGDTLYQMILKSTYLNELAKKYANNKMVLDIISSGLIMFFFYGDDHLARWPKIMNNFLLYTDSTCLLTDYIAFCCKNFGSRCKLKELKIFDNLYGQHYFDCIDGVMVENLTLAVEGPMFLKNSVSNVYASLGDVVDYKKVGVFPYRSTLDVSSKLNYSLNASSDVRIVMCQASSMARLCSGNLEAYEMCYRLYMEIQSRYGDPTIDDWKIFYESNKSRSLHGVIEVGSAFPSLSYLHKIQNDGFESGEGFVAKDRSGNVAAANDLYAGTGGGILPKSTWDNWDDPIENFILLKSFTQSEDAWLL